MKHISAYLMILIVLGLQSCETSDDTEIGVPFSKIEGIKGSWEVGSVVSVDEGTPLKDEWDISKFFTSDPDSLLSVSFDISAMTYEVSEGKGRNYMGKAGSWNFDNPDYPEKLFLYPLSGDTIEIIMGATVREFDPTLTLNYTKTNCDDVPIVTYKYLFNRVSN